MSWQVLGDVAAIAGGIRALLVQLLHPLAMAGVADHSDYRAGALIRLQRTSAYVTTLTFGSTRDAFDVSRTVRRLHERVHGWAPDGRPYDADDPHLLAWVSVALTSSFLATDRAYAARRVTGVEADRFVAEQSRGAALLDRRVDVDALARDGAAVDALRRGTLELPMIADGTLPVSVAELDTTLAAFRPELTLNHQGRDAARFLLWPNLPVAVKAGYLPILAGALATVEPDLRREVRLPAWPLADAGVRISARAVLHILRASRGESPVVRGATARAAATMSRARGG